MSAQFKFKNGVTEERRNEIVAELGRAGFFAKRLFPGQKRPTLSAIFSVPDADAQGLQAALAHYKNCIEYVEDAPRRSLK